ncbi:MAG TPA: FAD-dependent oxidoreductase, partial [Acidimicrobiales bacterium]|nr:FAD-dependent oxidoreductase [Acidimicrobiales bacterium]
MTRLSRVGVSDTVADRRALRGRRWDCVVVGGGHNGLAAAAYLARAGVSVAVLERRDRVGGACTWERPFGDDRYVVSPCAYVVGLLDPRIIDELDLRGHGYRVDLVDPHLWCPFEDGTSLTVWDDDERTAEAIARLAPSDVDGYLAYTRLFARIRTALRGPPRDLW